MELFVLDSWYGTLRVAIDRDLNQPSGLRCHRRIKDKSHFQQISLTPWVTHAVSSALSPLVLSYVGFSQPYCATAENYSQLYGKDGAIVHILIFLAYLSRS